MFLLIIIYTPLVLLIFHYFYTSQEFFIKAFKLPGPPRLPIIGNLWDVICDNFDVLKTLRRVVAEGDGFAAAWVGYNLTVLVSNPELLHTLYTCASTVHRSDQYDELGQLIGYNGILISSGAKWKKSRKEVMSTFGLTPLNLLVDNMNWAAHLLTNYIRKNAGDNALPMLGPLRLTTAKTILKNILDIEIMNDTELSRVLEDHFEPGVEIAFYRQFDAVGRFNATFYLTPKGRRFSRHVKALQEWSLGLLRRKRADYQKLKADEQPLPSVWIYDMLEKYPNQPEEHLRDEFFHIFIAALDTTSGTMGYILLMLALHPEIQEHVFEEVKHVDSLLGSRQLTNEDLQHYQLLERVIKETLRLFPTVVLPGRKMVEDTYFGEHLVPKNANVVGLLTHSCRNPKFFPDPHQFLPDRFLPENSAKLPQYAYSAFGGGPRSCIGNRYAMAGMRVIVSTVLREFSIKTSYSSVQQVLQNERVIFTLRDKNRFPLIFQTRSSSSK